MTTVPFQPKPYPITLIGELLVDEIFNRSSGDISVVFGGSPANIAVNMTELGISDVQFFGAVGDDYYGRTLLRDMHSKGISTDHVVLTTKSTSIVRINRTEMSPIPSFYRAADYLIEYTDELDRAIKNSSILHFSYWPLSKEPAKSTILRAIQTAREHGTLVGFDPNYHSKLVGPDSITLTELHQLLPYIDIIKPSLDDAKRLFGDGHDIPTYLRKFVDLGVKLVVMTLGPDGLIAMHDGKTYRYPSLAKDVIDATGAGDAFTSGMYAGILRGKSLDVLLQLGSACSAYNLTHVGGLSYLPTLDDLVREFGLED